MVQETAASSPETYSICHSRGCYFQGILAKLHLPILRRCRKAAVFVNALTKATKKSEVSCDPIKFHLHAGPFLCPVGPTNVILETNNTS